MTIKLSILFYSILFYSICVWLGMYGVWAGLQAHLLMTGLAEVVTGDLGEQRLYAAEPCLLL